MMMKIDAANDTLAPIWFHIEELRKTFLSCAAVILAGFIFFLFFYSTIFHYLTSPLNDASLQHLEIKKERIYNNGHVAANYTLPSNATILSQISNGIVQVADSRTYLIPPGGVIEFEHTMGKESSLIIFSPMEGVLLTLKICFWAAATITSPIWLFIILRFIAPALKIKTREILLPFIFLAPGFFFLGMQFAYYLTIPFANSYLFTFNQEIGVNLWSLSHYVDYTLAVMIGNGLAFEICLIIFFMVHFQMITTQQMLSKRRYAWVCAFILGALLSPPDVMTQIFLALPLVCLYEICVIYAKFLNYRNVCKQRVLNQPLD